MCCGEEKAKQMHMWAKTDTLLHVCLLDRHEAMCRR